MHLDGRFGFAEISLRKKRTTQIDSRRIKGIEGIIQLYWQFFVVRIQACLNISQTFPVCNLGKGKTKKLIITGKFFDPMVAVICL